MAATGKTPRFKTLREQRLEGELGLIIDEMGLAMWNANKEAIANGLPLTMRMSDALAKFQDYCVRHYSKRPE